MPFLNMDNNFKEIVTKLEKPRVNHKGQGEVYIALPSDYEKAQACPMVIALHGSGREALSYRDVPFYTRQRDIALECGYVFACVSNGPDTYGLDGGYENVEVLFEYMRKEYKVNSKLALWASSAGGLMMHRFFRENKDVCGLLMGIFTIFDPLTTMLPLKSALRAFKANDIDELREKASFLSPQWFRKDIYSETQIVVAHGEHDKAVPISQSEQLYKQVSEHGGNMHLIRKPGGHSTQNFALYETPHFKEALLNYKRLL